MAKLNIKNGRIEDYTIVLSTRSYKHLGQITGIKSDAVQCNNHLNSANELSFTITKYDLVEGLCNVLNDEEYQRYKLAQTILWNQIVDYRLIWVKETNEYYEIKVSTEDAAETIKTVTATSLCEAELGQLNIDSLEINSESDIEREDYVITTFYNQTDPRASLLNRVLADKAPHYTIEYVDSSLWNIQRTFSVSGTNIYDFLTGEVSEQFNCLFVFNSAKRSISVYDLYTTCLDCGHREDFYDECPKCKSKNLKYFGTDTTIFVDKKNLTDSIHLETNADERKNCLKLIAGDDLMTATVRLLNQNGSDYIYYISDFQMDDMPEELVVKLKDYQNDYDDYTETYQEAMETYYEATDEILRLKSSMMPTIEQAEVTATTEAAKLTEANLSPVAISSVSASTSVATVNTALKNYAKVYVKSGYVKIEVNEGATFKYVGEHVGETALDTYRYGTWTGSFTVTNYSDKDDVVKTNQMSITVYDRMEEFTKQRVLKQIAEDDDDGSIFDVLSIEDIDEFSHALTYYSLNRLTSFNDAIQGAIDVLIQLNQGEKDSEFYSVLYEPYYAKLQACQTEMDKRQKEIDAVQDRLDKANESMTSIQNELNFRTYLGEELYNIYCAYRREDTYENANYISDGLSNVELIERAKEFLEAAHKELKRAAEPEYTITSTLKNFLVLDEFKPIVDYFELGNWIRVKVENVIYRLRLIGYSINFGSLQDVSVEFANVTKVKDMVHEAQEIRKTTQSMASSFTYVSKQAEKGNKAQSNVNDWIANGLNSALVNITSNDGNMLQNDHGILCRYKDKDTGEYSPKQLKILYNNIVLTKDGWKTCAQAIGEHSYTVYNPAINDTETYTGYGVTAEFLTAPHITGKMIIGGQIYSTNYSDGSFERAPQGTFLDLEEGTFSFAGGNLTYDGTDLAISAKSLGDSLQDVDVTAENLQINASKIQGKIKSNQIENITPSQINGDVSVKAENIITTNKKIQSAQIESLVSSKITGKVTSSQIENITPSQINGDVSVKAENINVTNKKIQSAQIENIKPNQIDGDVSVKAENINTSSKKIQSSQIESISVNQIDGSIEADSVKASNISGTIGSSQITSNLNNKNVTGTFEGSVKLSDVTTVSNGTTYNTVSGSFTVGTMTLTFINGLLVSTDNN